MLAPRARSIGDAIDQILFIALVGALAWAPLWLGSNRILAWGLNGMIFPGMLVAYELSRLMLDRPHPVSVRRIGVPAALFAGVVGWIGLQMSLVAPTAITHPIWALAGQTLDTPVSASISVNRQASALALLRLATDASVFWLALQLGRQPRRAHLLLRSVSAIVAAYSAFGLIATAFLGGAIPFLDGPAPGLVRSTFVNRNSFAAYAGMGLIVTIALIVRLYRQEDLGGGGPALYRLGRLIDATVRHGWTPIASGLLILVALLGAGSRGAILATGLGIATAMLLSGSRRKRTAAQQMLPVAATTIALAVALLFFGDIFVGRIAASGLDDATRTAVYAIMARSILDAPITGLGYGTFADVFPLYRDQSISTIGVWDKAHNTYLEVWQGLGLVFGTALIICVAWLLARCLIGAIRRRRDAESCVAAFCVGLLLAVHSLVDFSLQIQAVSLTFMALLGVGVAQSESSRNAVAD